MQYMYAACMRGKLFSGTVFHLPAAIDAMLSVPGVPAASGHCEGNIRKHPYKQAREAEFLIDYQNVSKAEAMRRCKHRSAVISALSVIDGDIGRSC